MAHSARRPLPRPLPRRLPRRLPRGLNFLLGGTVVAVGVLIFALVGGRFDLGIGSAPPVRIDEQETLAGG